VASGLAFDLVFGLASDLASADLVSADLISADLISADLISADLVSADLVSADLASADLVSADLVSADLAFDLASGQAGFGAGPAGCHTLNPLYSLYDRADNSK